MLEKIKTVFSEELVKGDKPIVTVFYATYCPFCMRFAPIFEKHSVNQAYIFAKADITDDSHPFWERFNISYVPTVIAFKNGRILAKREAKGGVGLNESDLVSLLDEISSA
ncbi:MAG: thioredoxin family protein [Nitrososphaerales archaeon]